MTINHNKQTLPSQRLNNNFRKYWVGQTISNFGSSITFFALPLLVYKLTGSALNLGLSSAANILPYLLFGLIIGAWTDRTNRKRLMVFTDIGRAIIVATIPLLALLGLLSVWWIYCVGFVQSTLTICFEAGQFAAIPSLVDQDDLVAANGRIQASYSGASIVGPALAGILVAFIPLTAFMLLDSLSFVISALLIAFISMSFNINTSHQEIRTSILQDIASGLRYVFSHPILRNISLMMSMINFVMATVEAQLILFAKVRLQANDTQVGFLYSAQSIGIVVLSLLAGPLHRKFSFSKIALTALMLDGLFITALAFTQCYWIALVFVGCSQGLGILFNINTGSLRQTIVPNHLLGRVMSIAAVLAWSSIPLGALAGALVIEWTKSIILVYSIIGVLVFLIALSFSLTPLGHAERYLTKENIGETATNSDIVQSP